MKLQQLSAFAETKTKDNVFVTLSIAVQYEPIKEKVYDAYYRLQDPSKQITSYVYDTVRAKVPALNLDDVFLQKDEIAKAVEEELESTMTEFGYSVVKALVVDIKPDEKVQAAMNEINAAQRLQVAAQSKAEASKIIVVKNAEADAEAKRLAGEGVAAERKAIVEGLRTSVAETAAALSVNPTEVMALVMMTQYFDTLREIGKQGTTIMLPHSPAGMDAIANEIRASLIAASKVQ